jgi:hypothetical protein
VLQLFYRGILVAQIVAAGLFDCRIEPSFDGDSSTARRCQQPCKNMLRLKHVVNGAGLKSAVRLADAE